MRRHKNRICKNSQKYKEYHKNRYKNKMEKETRS